jgi:ATP-dependent protease HslVU (ClpYQ) peptidase subunit
MTCIVAVAKDGVVYIGGDRFTTDGNWGRFIDGSPKIAVMPAFGRLEFLVGCAGDGRCCDVILNMDIREADVPDDSSVRWNDRDAEFNVREILVEAIRLKLAMTGALMKDDDGQDKGCTVLVGHMGRLFVIGENFSVSVITEDHVAIGAAKEYALGAIEATRHTGNSWHPRNRLMVALEVAKKYNITVSEPFDFLELGS